MTFLVTVDSFVDFNITKLKPILQLLTSASIKSKINNLIQNPYLTRKEPQFMDCPPPFE